MIPNTFKAGLGDQSGADSMNTDDSANLADKGIRRPSMIGGGNNLNSIHSRRQIGRASCRERV